VVEKLKTAHQLFDEIVTASKEMNSIYSIQILIHLVTSLLVITTQLFFIICNVSIELIFGMDISFLHATVTLWLIGTIFITLEAANLPVKEVGCDPFSIIQLI